MEESICVGMVSAVCYIPLCSSTVYTTLEYNGLKWDRPWSSGLSDFSSQSLIA